MAALWAWEKRLGQSAAMTWIITTICLPRLALLFLSANGARFLSPGYRPGFRRINHPSGLKGRDLIMEVNGNSGVARIAVLQTP